MATTQNLNQSFERPITFNKDFDNFCADFRFFLKKKIIYFPKKLDFFFFIKNKENTGNSVNGPAAKYSI